jgi:hypothetical protein
VKHASAETITTKVPLVGSVRDSATPSAPQKAQKIPNDKPDVNRLNALTSPKKSQLRIAKPPSALSVYKMGFAVTYWATPIAAQTKSNNTIHRIIIRSETAS